MEIKVESETPTVFRFIEALDGGDLEEYSRILRDASPQMRKILEEVREAWGEEDG